VGHQNAVGVKNQAIANKWCSAKFCPKSDFI
jgi:hypothetical protein